jgi:hypothetical protein
LRFTSRPGFFWPLLHTFAAPPTEKRHVVPDSDSDSLLWGRGFSDSGSGSFRGGWVIFILFYNDRVLTGPHGPFNYHNF